MTQEITAKTSEVFDFAQEYILEDSAVLLRPLLSEDFDNLLIFSLNEPNLWEYALKTAYGAENLQRFIAEALIGRTQNIHYPFIVFDKNTQRYAGTTRIYGIDAQEKNANIGFTWYGKEFQGTGLNKHAKFLLLSFVFEKLAIERVEFRADAQNARSIQAIKNLGGVQEGILRSNFFKHNGGRRDSIILSILRTEWLQGKKDELFQKLT